MSAKIIPFPVHRVSAKKTMSQPAQVIEFRKKKSATRGPWNFKDALISFGNMILGIENGGIEANAAKRRASNW